jgi:hypothetical protein
MVPSRNDLHSPQDQRGLTNGLHSSPRVFRSSSGGDNGPPGKTNGLTNGSKGRVNGLGRTNGLTNGRTNGLTNGITNGVRIGRVNGLTNGITNGFVNGAGAVNGFRLSYQPRILGPGPGPMRRKLLAVLVLVAIVLAVPYALVFTFPPEHVKIDGYFMDWMTAQVYTDSPNNPSPDTTLVGYAMKYDSEGSYFYIAINGRAFGDSNTGADAYYIFIDRDGNSLSGYSIRGLGADLLVQLVGWNGTLKSGTTYSFDPLASRLDFAGFSPSSSPTVAFKDGKIELATSVALGSRSIALVCARHTDGPDDWSDVNFRAVGAALVMSEIHDAPAVTQGITDEHVLSLTISGKGPSVSVSELRFQFLGSIAPISISAYEGPQKIGTSTNSTLTFEKPLRVNERSSHELVIVASFSESSDAGSFGLRLDESRPAIMDSNATVTIHSVQTNATLYYIRQAPGNIVIDGAFGDWDMMMPAEDASNDTFIDGTVPCWNPDVDIRNVKAASTATEAFFYMSVNGTMLGGSSIPGNTVRWVSGQMTNITNETHTLYGTDYAFVFIDIDRNASTGYYIGGSEACIAVVGKEGSILSAKAFKIESTGWVDAGDAEAALDGYQLEIGGTFQALGLTLGQNYPITFVAQDWRGCQDEASMFLPARAMASKAFPGMLINEIYSIPPSTRNSDWIELYNTGTTPVDIGGWQVWVDGVLVYTFPSLPPASVVQPGGFYVAYNLEFSSGRNYRLYDNADPHNLIDEVNMPSWHSKSYGRVGGPGDGYANWSTMNPTPGELNVGEYPIPEFGSLLPALAIVPIMFFVINRAERASKSAPEE